MKILLDGRLYRAATGGIGRYTRELISNLLIIDQKNEYTLLISPKDKEECNLTAPNLMVIVSPIVHFSLAEQLQLPKTLDKYKPDLVHFLNFNHPVSYHKPYITTIHDLTMTFFPIGVQKSLLRRLAYLAVMHHAASGAKAVITPTETVKKDVIKHLHAEPEKVFVTYEAAAILEKLPAKPSAAGMAKLKITKPYILFVSQWRPHKGIGKLIEAFTIIKDKLDIQLVICGQATPQFPEIPAALAASKNKADIIAPGFVSDKDLDMLYAGASLFVFPSWYEGFGLPPLEAMARAVPVASSNTSVMPEVLGEAAVYFDPYSPQDMAEKITGLLKDPARLRELSRQGQKQARQYSWPKMARETLAVYEKVYENLHKNRR